MIRDTSVHAVTHSGGLMKLAFAGSFGTVVLPLRLCPAPMISMCSARPITTLKGEHEYLDVIKKSKFIAKSAPARTFEDGKAVLERVRVEHAKARHVCWGWHGSGSDKRCSDDGEPGGTAGQPILQAIESEGISSVVVVVTRYFGGIKLGTGGLARAYGGAARRCLQEAQREVSMPVTQLRITAPLSCIGAVFNAISSSDCERLSEEYTDTEVVVVATAQVDKVTEVQCRVTDATRGASRVETDF